MKRFLLMFLALGMYSINVYAQTTELRIEEDGFEWYLVSQNGLYGALNFRRETLIPTMYDTITYKPFSSTTPSYNSGGFKVKRGNSLGGYNVDGKCIIPIERNYKGFQKNTDVNVGTYYIVVLQDDRVGICDMNGMEKFIINEPGLWIVPQIEEGMYYYKIEELYGNSDHCGVADSRGNVIIRPKYFYVWIENNKFRGYKTFNDADNDNKSTFCSISKKNDFHNILIGNVCEKKMLIFQKIGLVPFSGHIKKVTDKTDGTAMYLLESENAKGIRDISGKWKVPLCKDYKQVSFSNRQYYLVNDNMSHWGLYSTNGDKILDTEYDAIESAGGCFIKIKKNGCLGITSLEGKEVINTSRGYTSIGYDSSKGTFAVAKPGYTGFCDARGNEISMTKLPPTANDIKAEGGYASAEEMMNGNTKYYKVTKNGKYGLTSSEGKVIVPVEMEALESAGTGYLRFKIGSFWGVMIYAGKIIIPTDRGYTKIGDYVSFTKRFPYEMAGYKGECNNLGVQVSKIKVVESHQSPVSSSSVASFISEDLKAYDLRGKVKKCKWKGKYVDNDYLPILKINDENLTEFSQDGKLQITNYDIIRDNSGRITQLKSTITPLSYELYYDASGRLIEVRRAMPFFGSKVVDKFCYSYDSSNRIESIRAEKNYSPDNNKEPWCRFEYVQSDSKGNWIKRIAKCGMLGNITQSRVIEYY